MLKNLMICLTLLSLSGVARANDLNCIRQDATFALYDDFTKAWWTQSGSSRSLRCRKDGDDVLCSKIGGDGPGNLGMRFIEGKGIYMVITFPDGNQNRNARESLFIADKYCR